MRHHRLGIFLKIIRRQPVIRIGQEFFEEAPGAPGNGPQRAHMVHRDGFNILRHGRQADPARHCRRGQPQQRERYRRLDRLGPHESNRGERSQRQHHSAGHALVDPGKFEVHGVPRLRGRHPLQHVFVRHQHPHQRAQNRIAHQPRLIGHERERQPNLRNAQ